MEGFTLIDGVVAAVIVLSALLAYGRGLVREAMAIVGWIVAAIVAFLFAPQVQPLVKEIPMVGEFVADSCIFSLGGAFAIVFVAALIVMSLFTPLFSSLVQRTALGGVDQGLGFLFGVVRGVLLVAIAFFVYRHDGPGGADGGHEPVRRRLHAVQRQDRRTEPGGGRRLVRNASTTNSCPSATDRFRTGKFLNFDMVSRDVSRDGPSDLFAFRCESPFWDSQRDSALGLSVAVPRLRRG